MPTADLNITGAEQAGLPPLAFMERGHVPADVHLGGEKIIFSRAEIILDDPSPPADSNLLAEAAFTFIIHIMTDQRTDSNWASASSLDISLLNYRFIRQKNSRREPEANAEGDVSRQWISSIHGNDGNIMVIMTTQDWRGLACPTHKPHWAEKHKEWFMYCKKILTIGKVKLQETIETCPLIKETWQYCYH